LLEKLDSVPEWVEDIETVEPLEGLVCDRREPNTCIGEHLERGNLTEFADLDQLC
jgi:hypothetical protein